MAPAADAPPRYRQVADRIAAQIEKGTYRVGDAIPSVRDGRRLFQVSPGTLLAAYRRLEDRGYIRARPQSGYYVRARAALVPAPPPATPTARSPRPIQVDLALQMLARMADPAMLQLGAAVPHASFLPTRALNQRLARVVRHHAGAIHTYGPPAGLPALRAGLARWMADAGCTLRGEDIVVTHGCTEAVNLCLRAVTRPGDTVAIESPTYYGLLIALKGLGLRALPIETSPVTGLSPEALRAAAARRRVAAVVCSPSFANPTGACMPLEARRALAAWADETDTPVIEDDIYGELAFDDARPTPLIALSRRGTAVYCSSMSKTLSSGFRVGWCVPGRHLARVEELKAGGNPTSPIATHLALCDFLDHGGLRQHLRRIRRQYRDQVDRFSDSVARHFPGPVRLHRPAGGHLLWVELPPHCDAAALFPRALAQRITTAPGPIFSPTGGFTHHLRLNCAVPWSPKTERAIATLGRLLRDAD